MKEWVKWMMSNGGKIGSIPIEGDPNNLWNSSPLPLNNKYNIIQTMVSHPEDVALYFVFGWGTTKPITEIGHEYRFEYYANKSLTNYEGYKAFFMAHQNKYNNDWICNELVKKQKIFVKIMELTLIINIMKVLLQNLLIMEKSKHKDHLL